MGPILAREGSEKYPCCKVCRKTTCKPGVSYPVSFVNHALSPSAVSAASLLPHGPPGNQSSRTAGQRTRRGVYGVGIFSKQREDIIVPGSSLSPWVLESLKARVPWSPPPTYISPSACLPICMCTYPTYVRVIHVHIIAHSLHI